MKFTRYNRRTGGDDVVNVPLAKPTLLVIGALVVMLVGIILLSAGCREYGRYQHRQDAANQVRVAEQTVKINRVKIAATKADAERRYQESVGIRRAQDEISKTLTPLYVQHEAIQAQKHAASAGNAQIYIPSGTQGVPLVRTIDPGPSK